MHRYMWVMPLVAPIWFLPQYFPWGSTLHHVTPPHIMTSTMYTYIYTPTHCISITRIIITSIQLLKHSTCIPTHTHTVSMSNLWHFWTSYALLELSEYIYNLYTYIAQSFRIPIHVHSTAHLVASHPHWIQHWYSSPRVGGSTDSGSTQRGTAQLAQQETQVSARYTSWLATVHWCNTPRWCQQSTDCKLTAVSSLLQPGTLTHFPHLLDNEQRCL